jgi:hypothetical protein
LKPAAVEGDYVLRDHHPADGDQMPKLRATRLLLFAVIEERNLHAGLLPIPHRKSEHLVDDGKGCPAGHG